MYKRQRYGIGFRENVAEALMAARDRYSELRAQVLARIPSGDRMALEYTEILQSLLADRDAAPRAAEAH